MGLSPNRTALDSKLNAAVADSRAIAEDFLGTIGTGESAQVEPTDLAQAILAGERSYEGELDHQSWIEGAPPLHTLLESKKLILDLHPVESEADFKKRYRCNPKQLRELVGRYPDRFKMNLRSINRISGTDEVEGLSSYLDGEALRLVGPIIAAAQPSSLYVNGERRIALFDCMLSERGAFDREVSEAGNRAKALLEPFGRARAMINAMPDHGGASRAGVALEPAAFRFRLAYYAAYIKREPTTARDEIDALLDPAQTFSDNHLALVDAIVSLNDFHIRYTAPLTGAYGHVFSTKMGEMNRVLEGSTLLEQARLAVPDHMREHDKAGMTLLADILMGAVEREKNKLVPQVSAFSNLFFLRVSPENEILTDHQWELLMKGLELNDHLLDRRIAFLNSLKQVARGGEDRTDFTYGEYLAAASEALARYPKAFRDLMEAGPDAAAEHFKEFVKDVLMEGGRAAGAVAGAAGAVAQTPAGSHLGVSVITLATAGAVLGQIGMGTVAKCVALNLGHKIDEYFRDGSGCSPHHRAVYSFINDVQVPR